MMKYNLHTHCAYCRHGEGKISEYVDEAVRNGLSVLGFSDHCPYPDDLLSVDNGRMWYSSLPLYMDDVKREKSHDDIEVLLGWECDWIKGREEWIKEVGENSDYLIFGLHYLFDDDGTQYSPFHRDRWEKTKALRVYGERFLSAASSGLFLFAAHPDLYMNMCDEFGEEEKALARDIISVAKEKHIVMEVNGNGLQKAKELSLPYSRYPRREFWEMVKNENLPVVVSADTHSVEGMMERLDGALCFASSLGLDIVEPEIVDGKVVIRRGEGK